MNLRLYDYDNDQQTIDELSGQGTVYLNGALFILGNGDGADGANDFGGQIVNGARTGGGLTKVGNGTQILSGANTYTGDTTVEAGTLLVEGSLGDTAVTVQSGAYLGGSGTFGGPITIDPDGFLTPGTSIGLITCSNDVVLSGTYLAEIDADTLAADLISVTGSGICYCGGTLQVDLIAGTLDVGDTFNLIDGTISGQFDSLVLPGVGGLAWDTSALYTLGEISLAAPEPGTLTLLLLAACCLVARRRRMRRS